MNWEEKDKEGRKMEILGIKIKINIDNLKESLENSQKNNLFHNM